MESSFNKFRKAKIGGFNRKDVIDYIEKIQNDFFDYKKETDETVKNLREKIAELESLADNGAKALQQADAAVIEAEVDNKTECCPADEITLATSKLKNVTDELCNSLNEFIDKLSENSIPVVLNVPFEDECYVNEEIEEIHQREPVLSKVESILKSASSIFLECDDAEKTSIEDFTKENFPVKKDINDILDRVGFVC